MEVTHLDLQFQERGDQVWWSLELFQALILSYPMLLSLRWLMNVEDLDFGEESTLFNVRSFFETVLQPAIDAARDSCGYIGAKAYEKLMRYVRGETTAVWG